MTGPKGIGRFGVSQIPSEEFLKKLKLFNIKTRAGKIAFLMLMGNDATLGRVAKGVNHAKGALSMVSRVLKDRTKEQQENK